MATDGGTPDSDADMTPTTTCFLLAVSHRSATNSLPGLLDWQKLDLPPVIAVNGPQQFTLQ